MEHKVSKDTKEFRFTEIRANNEDENGDLILEGYPVVFNQETLIGDEEDGFIEVIDRHALDNADMSDCPLKYQHNDSKGILARTRNGSLKLKIDDKGLFMRAKLQKNVSDHVDIYNCCASGLLDKMSFAFTVAEQEIDRSTHPVKRIIRKIDKLWDVSCVDIPAYDGSSIYARSKEIVGEQLRNLQKSLDSEKGLDSSKLELEKLKARIKGGKF